MLALPIPKSTCLANSQSCSDSDLGFEILPSRYPLNLGYRFYLFQIDNDPLGRKPVGEPLHIPIVRSTIVAIDRFGRTHKGFEIATSRFGGRALGRLPKAKFFRF